MDASDPLAAAFLKVETTVLGAVGQAMQLRPWGERISSQLRRGGVNCTVVKGPVFAARLYPHPSDRLYSDVDVVIEPSAVARAAEILTELGFRANDMPGYDFVDLCEFKWVSNSNALVHVELQTNLIHSSKLRKRISIDFDAIADAGGGDPHDATALLLVAGVHATVGHQYSRLELLVDVLQAVRERAGKIDAQRLLEVSQRIGARRAIAASLVITGRMFQHENCIALAEQLMPRGSPLEWSLLSPEEVFAMHSPARPRFSWRRKLFRVLIHRPAPLRARDLRRQRPPAQGR